MAGFALVTKGSSFSKADVWGMADFFLVRRVHSLDISYSCESM